MNFPRKGSKIVKVRPLVYLAPTVNVFVGERLDVVVFDVEILLEWFQSDTVPLDGHETDGTQHVNILKLLSEH